MSITPQQAYAVYSEADCLHSRAEIEAALDRMALDISYVLAEANPLVITVMQGGLITAGMLLPRLAFPLQVDYLHATRYRGKTSGADLHWIVRPSQALADRIVLLVDDIHDEGHTLEAIVEACRQAGARRVYSAVLVNKRHDRKAAYRADFVGVEVEDRYVFGYGMDYKEYLRNAPGIFAVKEEHA
ncbi:MAG: hypoxanthine-guanine phosphoribosyltransferase [Gammaproteobacteria bacterium]|nr:hypoxanthine-guanine phosphoribosyltransferase [Gammaproteobacteria bacterium]